MIEQHIIEWIELGDSIQKIELYNERSITFYEMNYLLSQYNNFSEYFYFFIIILYFLQIWELNIETLDENGDCIMQILKYIQKAILFHKFVNDDTTFLIFLSITVIFYIASILISLTSIIIFSKHGAKKRFLISINSFLNILNIYFINGPSIHILFYRFFCKDGTSTYICSIKTVKDIIILIFMIIYALFLIFGVMTATLYFNDIGFINKSNIKCKINDNFTTIIILMKMIYFIFNLFLVNFINHSNHKLFLLIYLSFMMLFNIIISVYTYKDLYYYNKRINSWFHYGWYYTSWFSICIFLKYLITIKDITLYVIFGLIIITLAFYFNNKQKYLDLISEFNFFESNSLKEIEIYNHLLLDLLNKNDKKSKILISGIIRRFEEYISNNSELYELYIKTLSDNHLQVKFTSKNELTILSIIFIIYSSNIEKSKYATDLTLSLCYFLINRFKNSVYAVWLCSKLKTSTLKQSYYKFVLMQEIKDYLIDKMKSKKKITIKTIEIGSSILFHQYVELFKIKIYDATCSQIEYFDILRNKIATTKTIDNYLSVGEDVLNLRREVLSLWDKIILLNPFCNESAHDFLLYIGEVLQDDILVKSEEKKFNELQEEKLPEKTNAYYSMFDQDITTVLLSDGFTFNGKIIYATPNFQTLFMFSGKEIINTTIDDLLPEVIQNFHKFLIEDAIKFSNIEYIFKKRKDAFLKGKNGMIFNINLYIKPVPNFSCGLIFFIYLQKISEQNFIIIADENFIVNGFTEIYQIGTNFTLGNTYDLSNIIKGHHIGLIIPEILLQLDYDDKTNTFTVPKSSIDLKGYLYSITNFRELDDKIQNLLEVIKKRKSMENDNNNDILDTFEEYDELIKYISKLHSKSFSIFYRIELHEFIGGKYKYYRIYITNDTLNGDSALMNNNNNKAYYNQTILSKLKNDDFNSNINTKLKKEKNIRFIKLKGDPQEKIENKNENKEKDKDKEKGKDNEEENKKNNNNQKQGSSLSKNKNKEIQSAKSNSVLAQSNAEPVIFNKVKGHILKKNDCSHVKEMRYLSYIFVPINIILIIFEYINTKYGIDRMIEFLQENKYFTHVKICSACVYISAINLKLVKEGHIHKQFCPNTNCTTFYIDILQKVLVEIRSQKMDVAHYFSDFQKIFDKNTETDLNIFNSLEKDNYNLDMNNFLNLMISHGMKIIANIYEYYEENNDENKKEKEEILDVYLRNLIENSLKYFNSEYKLLTGREKEKKCYKIAIHIPISIGIYLIFLGYTVYIYYSYIILIKDIHIFYFDKLMNFSSQNFEIYLKKIEEVKKNFRDDSNDNVDEDEDEKNMEENEIKDENENNSKTKTDKKDDNTDTKDSKKKKQNKIQQQRMKNKRVISDYLCKINVKKILKFGIIFLLSTTYYLTSIIVTIKMKQNYLQFDAIIDQINNVYFDYFKIFLIFKDQLEKYDRTQNKSNIIIPDDNEIERPKLGETLMNIIKNPKYSKEYLEMFESLYNDNACKILTNNEAEYEVCRNVLSSILTKGLEQSIVHLNNIITTIINDLNALKQNKTLDDIYEENTIFSDYEVFMEYYMLIAFLKTQNIFDSFKNDEKLYIYNISKIILSVFFIVYFILFILLLVYIYSYKDFTGCFLSFIGIIPPKYMADDDEFYQQVIGLDPFYY